MGFKVVLVGATESAVAKQFLSKTDDLPWELYICGEDFTAESDASVRSFFQKKTPCAALSLMAEPGDHAPVTSLKNIVSVCGDMQIPVLHQSSYWAIEPDDVRDEVSESLRVDQHQGHAEFANFEKIASSVTKHIILRSSWILDGDGAGLLAGLVPVLLAGRDDVVVSDHDFGAPVSCAYIGDVMVALIHQLLSGSDNWGVYHLHSADACSEAEFCDHLVRQLQKELEFEVSFPNVAAMDDERRFFSMNANLVGRRITDDFGVQAPTWRRGFGRLLREWVERHQDELALQLKD